MTKIINQVAAYYFPTTVLLVDDDKEYLENVENFLDNGTAIYKSFNNPLEVYEYIKTHFKRQHLPDLCVDQKIDTARFNREINVNLEPIQQEVFNPKRFEHISVVVADHDMPEMKGLELLKKLKNLPIRKILLTGRATVQEALAAFNEGIIDQFISKDIENFEDYVNETIKKQCIEQFKSDTKIIINSLVFERSGYEPSCLNSEAFMTLLDNLVNEHHVSEYYLIDDSGSYIFFDNNGKASWLIVKNADDLNTDIMLAEDSDEPPSQEIIQQLKEHKLILALLSDDNREIPAKDWMERGLLHPLKKFTSDRQDYYYAYFGKDNGSYGVDKDKIISFRKYQEELPG
jgi:CheY-like chemotaxis protein